MAIQHYNKTTLILKLLISCVAVLLFQRMLFFILYYSQFEQATGTEIIKAFLLGTLIDAITSIYFLLPVWLLILFFNVENRLVKNLILTFTIIGFALLYILNIADIGYYPITKKRMGAEFINLLPEAGPLMSAYIKDYSHLFLFLIACMVFSFWFFRKQIHQFKKQETSFKIKLIHTIGIIVVFLIIIRGGFRDRPLMPIDIPSIVQPNLQWLTSNTPFQFIHTLENKNIATESYFDETEAENMIELKKEPTHPNMNKKNVLIILLESFCSDRLGLHNPNAKQYTPFMDSLLSNARTYQYGMATGRMTIDALPSVLSSIPSFMDKNYCYSNYSNNHLQGIGPLLEKEGYQTCFFYGGPKTSFGFESFIKLNFSNTFYDQSDYTGAYGNSGWGVDDHLYLPFIAKKLKALPQPFCASFLTLSLHHPFPVPEPYKTSLNNIKDPIKKSLRYTDIALQQFFNEIKNEPWYKNSIIAICADHVSGSMGDFEGNVLNEFAIPISFIAVGDSSFNKPQTQSISQIDMYPTVLDYIGYNKPYTSLGKSAIAKQNPSVEYQGNSMYVILDYPYAMQFDNNQQKVFRFFRYNENRTTSDVTDNEPKKQELEKQIKAYIQVFSYRLNKNQF